MSNTGSYQRHLPSKKVIGQVEKLTTTRRLRRAAGTVGAYTTGSDIAAVRRARAAAGHVTLSGKAGLGALWKLRDDGDLWGVDLDPAEYLSRPVADDALFPIDWVACQRELGLPTLRSAGIYVPAKDSLALNAAFDQLVPSDVVRVVSLNSSWLRPSSIAESVAAIRNADNPIALVLADAFDPLAADGAVDGLRTILEVAREDDRPIELLRSDIVAIAFAAAGGAVGTIGLSTSTRHHGLPLGSRAGNAHRERQSSPLAYVAPLASWQRGTTLGALSPFAGTNSITDCGCAHCGDRSLLRFDRVWTSQVPAEVRDDARLHDIASWAAIARQVLSATEPEDEWRRLCQAAMAMAGDIADEYKLAIEVPGSITGWV